MGTPPGQPDACSRPHVARACAVAWLLASRRRDTAQWHRTLRECGGGAAHGLRAADAVPVWYHTSLRQEGPPVQECWRTRLAALSGMADGCAQQRDPLVSAPI